MLCVAHMYHTSPHFLFSLQRTPTAAIFSEIKYMAINSHIKFANKIIVLNYLFQFWSSLHSFSINCNYSLVILQFCNKCKKMCSSILSCWFINKAWFLKSEWCTLVQLIYYSFGNISHFHFQISKWSISTHFYIFLNNCYNKDVW